MTTGFRDSDPIRNTASLRIRSGHPSSLNPKTSMQQVLQIMGVLSQGLSACADSLLALQKSLETGEKLNRAFAQLPNSLQVALQNAIGEKPTQELLSLSGEPDEILFQHSLLQFAKRLQDDSALEKASRVFELLAKASLFPVSQPIRELAQRAFDAMTGVGAVGPRAAFLLERVAEDSSDAKTFAPIVLASLAGNAVGAGTLSKLLSLTGETWYSRGLGAKLAAGFAGYGAEFLTFGLAGHALHPHAAPLSDELWRSAITIAAFKGTHYLGHQLFLKTHSFSELGLLTRFNQIAVPQLSMFTGMLAAHRLEEISGLRKPTDNATTITDTLFSMFTLGLGMHNVNRALGPSWRSLQLELKQHADAPSASYKPTLSESFSRWWKNLGIASGPIPAAVGPEIFYEPMQMSNFSDDNRPPSSIPPSGAKYLAPKNYEVQQIEREFGVTLLHELFGAQKDAAVKNLATLYLNRPELREKYSAIHFADADLWQRRALFRQLMGDSHSDKVAHENNLGKTRVQTGLFNQSMALFIAFGEHNKEALDALKAQKESPKSDAIVLSRPSGEIAKAIPQAPTEPKTPEIWIAGEAQTLMPNFGGQFVLGRHQFFGDSTVSMQHLVMSWRMGAWGVMDGQSTFGSYYYDASRRSWEALRNDQYHSVNPGELYHVGNTYYRAKLWGARIEFEPVHLPADVPPNPIKRATAVTVGNDSYRVLMYATHWGTEKGHLRLGNVLFQFENGQWHLSDIGVPTGVLHNESYLPKSFKLSEPGIIEPTIRSLLQKGDKIKFADQIYLVDIAEDGGLTLFQTSLWTEGPPSKSNPVMQNLPPQPMPPQPLEVREAPTLFSGHLKMNSARVLYVGNGEKTLGWSKEGYSEIAWSLTLEKKPLIGGKPWVLLEYSDVSENFRVKNLSLGNSEVFILKANGQKVPLARDRIDMAAPGDKLIIRGHEFVLNP